MGTMFFHESHFQGLLERVRERGRTNVAQRVADQVNRLFATCGDTGKIKKFPTKTLDYSFRLRNEHNFPKLILIELLHLQMTNLTPQCLCAWMTSRFRPTRPKKRAKNVTSPGNSSEGAWLP